MSASRDNNGKPMLSFVLQFPTACEGLARVKELGAVKYERDNWKKGGKPDWEYLDAALRHMSAYMQGEMFAEDTGCTHLAHAMWNIMALQELNNTGVTHDPALFAEMLEYWAVVRSFKDEGRQPPTIQEYRDAVTLDPQKIMEEVLDSIFGPQTQPQPQPQPQPQELGQPSGYAPLPPGLGAIHRVEQDEDGVAKVASMDIPGPMAGFLGSGTVLFEEPLEVPVGHTVRVDMKEKKAEVICEHGEVVQSTPLKLLIVEQPEVNEAEDPFLQGFFRNG